MFTGVPQKERWWFWVFFAWIFFSLGPGLLLASKPVFIGYFPLLYVYCFVFWIISMVLCYIVGYKMKFTEMPEDIKPDNES
jgi:hypothetical protein